MNTESLVGKLARKSYEMEGSLTFKLGEEELEPGMRSRIILRPKPNRGTNKKKKRKQSAKIGKEEEKICKNGETKSAEILRKRYP
ncbi:unnamed protein product [Prunus brigantina]